MTVPATKAARVPRLIPVFSPFLRRLLAVGLPVGPNVLITIAGRTSGRPRTTPVAIIDVDGRRWIWSPWGGVHWVLNLRAAGHATITVRRREEAVRAVELTPAERVAFFRDVLGPYAHAMRGGMAFVKVVDQVDLDDPEEAAARTAVFELHRARGSSSIPTGPSTR